MQSGAAALSQVPIPPSGSATRKSCAKCFVALAIIGSIGVAVYYLLKTQKLFPLIHDFMEQPIGLLGNLNLKMWHAITAGAGAFVLFGGSFALAYKCGKKTGAPKSVRSAGPISVADVTPTITPINFESILREITKKQGLLKSFKTQSAVLENEAAAITKLQSILACLENNFKSNLDLLGFYEPQTDDPTLATLQKMHVAEIQGSGTKITDLIIEYAHTEEEPKPKDPVPELIEDLLKNFKFAIEQLEAIDKGVRPDTIGRTSALECIKRLTRDQLAEQLKTGQGLAVSITRQMLKIVVDLRKEAEERLAVILKSQETLKKGIGEGEAQLSAILQAAEFSQEKRDYAKLLEEIQQLRGEVRTAQFLSSSRPAPTFSFPPNEPQEKQLEEEPLLHSGLQVTQDNRAASSNAQTATLNPVAKLGEKLQDQAKQVLGQLVQGATPQGQSIEHITQFATSFAQKAGMGSQMQAMLQQAQGLIAQVGGGNHGRGGDGGVDTEAEPAHNSGTETEVAD